MVRETLDEAWNWFSGRVGGIVGTVVDAFLGFVDRVVRAVDGVLELLWREVVKPVLDNVFGVLGRVFGFAWDVVEVVYDRVVGAFRSVYGFVSVYVHEIELRVFDVVVSAVRVVYDAVSSMFVNVYNAVRGLYVGLRDVTSSFILSTVRRIRERLSTIITVDLWILGCWRAFQGSLESFSFGDFLKAAVLCMVAPVASGYIAGIITSLTPVPGTEFPGFIPRLEFPELRGEDMPRFSVVAPPPVGFPSVGVSTLPSAHVMDLGVRYEVVGVVVRFFVLSDGVGLGLGDVWSYFAWSDEVSLLGFAGVGVSYPAVVDVVDLIVSTVVGGVSYPAVVDVVDLVFPSVGVGYPSVVDTVGLVVSSVGVSYPSVVDTVDLVVGAGVSVG